MTGDLSFITQGRHPSKPHLYQTNHVKVIYKLFFNTPILRFLVNDNEIIALIPLCQFCTPESNFTRNCHFFVWVSSSISLSHSLSIHLLKGFLENRIKSFVERLTPGPLSSKVLIFSLIGIKKVVPNILERNFTVQTTVSASHEYHDYTSLHCNHCPIHRST